MNKNRITTIKLWALKKLKTPSGMLFLAGSTYFVGIGVYVYNNPSYLSLAITKDIEQLSKIHIPQFLRHSLFTLYCKKYDVVMEDLQKPLREYKTFSEFFTRQIKKRNISKAQRDILSPAQGTIVSIGTVQNLSDLTIAKGISYSVGKLLYGQYWKPNQSITEEKQKTQIKQLESVSLKSQITKLKSLPNSKIYQIIIYLAPGNYHRFHSPCNLTVTNMLQIPGSIYPVHLKSLQQNGGKVYEENCRKILTCSYERDHDSKAKIGQIYLAFVGAMNVSNIYLNKFEQKQLSRKNKNNVKNKSQPINFKQGEEIGYFNLGSTIILFVESNQMKWQCEVGQKVKYGDIIGKVQQKTK